MDSKECKYCHKKFDRSEMWSDEQCQMCWEDYSSHVFWEMIGQGKSFGEADQGWERKQKRPLPIGKGL